MIFSRVDLLVVGKIEAQHRGICTYNAWPREVEAYRGAIIAARKLLVFAPSLARKRGDRDRIEMHGIQPGDSVDLVVASRRRAVVDVSNGRRGN